MADKKISDLTAASSLALADLLEIENVGGNSRKMTAQKIVDLLGWKLVDQTGAETASATWTYSVNVANVDVIGLAGFRDLLIIGRGLVSSVSGNRGIQCSVDNGSSFYSASGDYVSATEAGVEANASAILTHDTAATAARSLFGLISGANVTGTPKLGIGPGTAANSRRLFVASLSPINAIRLVPGGGGNLTAGSLYVLGRR